MKTCCGFNVCCREGKDEGEWIEPVKNKNNKRHVGRKNPSIQENASDDSTSSIKSRPRVSWDDLTEDLVGTNGKDDTKGSVHRKPHDPFSAPPALCEFGKQAMIDDEMPTDDQKDFMKENCHPGDKNVVEERLEERSISPFEHAGDVISRKMNGSMQGMKKSLGKHLGKAHPCEILKPGLRPTLDQNKAHSESHIGEKTKALAETFVKNLFVQKDKGNKQKVAITSIATLGDGHFLTASRDGPLISLWKFVDGLSIQGVELIRTFEGHSSGVTTLVKLDAKGRFLSAGKDLTVRLWDSRYNCDDDDEDDDEGAVAQLLALLATFANPDKRMTHAICVIEQGSYVRPTDSIDRAMIAAMAKKAVLEGTQSMHEAAIKRDIIECSGQFATASKNGKSVNIWKINVADKAKNIKTNNVAEITLVDSLDHEFHVEAMEAVEGKGMIVTGDVFGDVFLWNLKRVSFAKKQWKMVRKFTWRKEGHIYAPGKVLQRSITAVCFLEGETKIVACTKKGSVYVWSIDGKTKDVVYKKDALKMKSNRLPLTAIQRLPSIEDPRTNEKCLAFSLASEDGFVVSYALQMDLFSKSCEYKPLIFHEAEYGHGLDDSPKNGFEKMSVSALALLETNTPSTTDGKSRASMIVGDSVGGIHMLLPIWCPDLVKEGSLADHRKTW